MSTEKNRSNRGWRSDAPSSRPKASGKRAWQEQAESPATAARKGWSRKTKLRLTALGFLACAVGAAVIIWLLRPPKPQRLILVGGTYDKTLAVPANDVGWTSLDELNQWASGDRSSAWFGTGHRPNVKDGPVVLDSKMSWADGLEESKEETLVIYLAVHGGADEKGAYLLPDGEGSDPGDASRRVRLADVVKRLKEPGLSKKKIFLILDATEMPADPQSPLGMLHNDFTRRLKEDLNKEVAEAPNLVLFCSSDDAQRSWVSEEWRETIFGHYVVEGMKGAAPAKAKGNALCGDELASYVTERVTSWVQKNRDMRQTPFLLPAGEEGEKRAHQMEVALMPEQPYKEQTGSAAPGASFKADDLREPWDSYWKLRASHPSPAVYSPRLWRHYRDLLLRYEQLVRTGQAGKLQNVREQLHKTAKEIESLKGLDKSSLTNTLRMPAALGKNAGWLGDVKDQFERVWSAPDPAEREKRWKDLKEFAKGKGDDADQKLNVRLLRVQCDALLLTRASESERNLKKAVEEILPLLDEADEVRPAELHFAAMYERLTTRNEVLKALATDRPWGDVQKALSVRRLAEQVASGTGAQATDSAPAFHPYSEVVYLWTLKKLEEADAERRLGEDLLFGPTAGLDEARTHFANATKLYQEADRDARAVRTACEVRDQVLADLPYYAQWLALRRTLDEAENSEVERDVDQVVALWKDVHALAQRLEKTDAWALKPPPADGGAKFTRSVEGDAEAVRKAFREIADKFDVRCTQLGDTQTHTNWHQIEEVLTVPLIEPGQRMRLLENSRTISNQFNSHEREEAATPPEEEKLRSLARRQAVRRGRLTLAMLGERLFDSEELKKTDSTDLLQGNEIQPYSVVAAAFQNRMQSDEQWWKSVTQIGDQIGHRWKHLPRATESLIQASHVKPPDRALPDLLTADELSRAGCATLAFAPPTDQDAGDELHRLRLQGFLVWQAERAHRDRWYDEKGSDVQKPYYKRAVDAYLSNARELLMQNLDGVSPVERDARLAGVKKKEGELRVMPLVPECVNVKEGSQVYWTSEPRLDLTYRLRAPDRPGYPLVWKSVEGPLPPLRPQDAALRVITEFQRGQTLEVTDRLQLPRADSDDANGKTGQVHYLGMYRGQPIKVDTPVQLYFTPDIHLYDHVMPQGVAIAAWAGKGFQHGHLAIVLDLSGSMIDPADQKGGRSKKDCAIDALKEVLGKVPPGTRLSMWIFGQSKNGGRITRILNGEKWSGQPTDLDNLITELRSYEPERETPLMEAMIQAKDAMMKEGKQDQNRAKALLVLTDGIDNLFKGSIKDAIQDEFRNTQIAINLVFFAKAPDLQDDKDKEEARKAEDDFSTVKNLNPPGRFWKVEGSTRLAYVISEAIRPRMRLFKQTGGRPEGVPSDWPGVPLTFPGEGLKGLHFSPLLPANLFYEALVPPYTEEAKQLIRLLNGQRLIVNLVQEGKDVVYERAIYGDLFLKDRPQSRNGSWLLGTLKNRVIDRTEKLDVQVSLEYLKNLRVQSDGNLKQLTPSFSWFEVEPEGVAGAPPRLQAGTVGRYPAPVWYLKSVDPWVPEPGQQSIREHGAHPFIRTWCADPENPPAPAFRKKLELGKTVIMDEEVELRSQKVHVTVTVENHRVQLEEEGELKNQPCVVVRIAYEKGKPVVALLEDLNALGHEHRVYAPADRSTTMYWLPDAVEKLAKQDFRLQLIDLNEFKNSVRAADGYLELRVPTSPDLHDDGLPPPAVETFAK